MIAKALQIAGELTKGALVNARVEFDTVCPNNHNKAVTFSQVIAVKYFFRSGTTIFPLCLDEGKQ